MGVGAGLYMCDVVKKSSRSLSHLLMSSCYCGETAGCIKMPLGMEVGLIPGEFVLDGNPVPPSAKRGA